MEVTIEHRVEWYDTDAAGHQHWSAVLRWVEAAEAELLRRHGLSWLFGRNPRVRHEVNYRSRVWFGETVRTRVWVSKIGTASLHFAFEVRGESALAADGQLIVAHFEPDSATASPWPDEARAVITTAMDSAQQAELTA